MLIAWSAWGFVRDALDVLMEGAPHGIDLVALEKTIRGVAGVASVHDLHAWTIADGFPIVTVHVRLDGLHHGTDIAAAVSARVREAHGIEHVTVQPEAPEAAPVPVSALVRRPHDEHG